MQGSPFGSAPQIFIGGDFGVNADPEQRLYSLGRRKALPPQIVSWVAQTTSYACERPAHRGKRHKGS